MPDLPAEIISGQDMYSEANQNGRDQTDVDDKVDVRRPDPGIEYQPEVFNFNKP